MHGTPPAIVEGVVTARVSASVMPVESGKAVRNVRRGSSATTAKSLVTGQKRATGMVVAQEMALAYAAKTLRDLSAIHVCLGNSEQVANGCARTILVAGMGAAKCQERDAYVMMDGVGMLVLCAPLDLTAFAALIVQPMRHVLVQVVVGMMELASAFLLSTVAGCTTLFYSRNQNPSVPTSVPTSAKVIMQGFAEMLMW